MDLQKLKQFLENLGEPAFRFKQIEEAYFSGKYSDFDQLTNISKNLREKLKDNFKFRQLIQKVLMEDRDSLKAQLELGDGRSIESVLMKYRDFSSVCLSCQVGCAMGCKFCATGKMGFVRNLTAEEIVEQVLFWKRMGHEIDRVVFMGMGEPFLNWYEVRKSILIIHDKIGMGWRKISVSTAGVKDGIQKFMDFGKEVNLAVSIHSLDQKVRKSIMPGAGNYRLDLLLEDIRRYVSKSKRQVFFEYALIDGINDSEKDAVMLAKFINSNKLYYLNLINLNPVTGIKYCKSKNINRFVQRLDKYRVKYTVRKSIGQNIKGACGQLVTSNE